MSRGRRNWVSRKAAEFLLQRDRAWVGLGCGRNFYVAFSQMGREKDAEDARTNMHASVDAFCDAQRAADKEMGGRTDE